MGFHLISWGLLLIYMITSCFFFHGVNDVLLACVGFLHCCKMGLPTIYSTYPYTLYTHNKHTHYITFCSTVAFYNTFQSFTFHHNTTWKLKFSASHFAILPRPRPSTIQETQTIDESVGLKEHSRIKAFWGLDTWKASNTNCQRLEAMALENKNRFKLLTSQKCNT